MHLSRRLLYVPLALAAFSLSVIPVLAAQDASLPNGATSINETYGDWALRCAIDHQTEKPAVVCDVTQTLIDQKSRKRVLGIGFRPNNGGIKGNLVMPFGLDLAKGVTMSIDAGPVSTPYAFKTCLPAGCIVPIDWASSTVKVLRTSTTLKVGATGDNSKPAEFKLSLKGFSDALDRAIALSGK